MKQTFEDLIDYLDTLNGYKLPNYLEIPNNIKMEETINYLNEILAPFYNDDNNLVTNYMINNYVKAKIVSSPIDKHYTNEQIGYILFISLLKNITSLKNIASLFSFDKAYSGNKEELYTFCKELEEEAVIKTNSQLKEEIKNLHESLSEEDFSKILANKSLGKGYKALRMRLENEKIINENYEFTTDYIFNSSSAAADIVSGYSCSGPVVWKNKEGKMLKELS